MIRIRRKPLPVTTSATLDHDQGLVNGELDYPSRVAAAKRLFALRNTPRNRVFAVVRSTLAEMCHGSRRCMYCEDAPADEVEHFRPKDLFPEHAFSWSNYLYSCGPCNGPKNNRWGILPARGASVIDVSRPRGAAVVPPRWGQPALIDPSRQDPLLHLIMDLKETFLIVPRLARGTPSYACAEYTIEVLKLNKDFLIESRATAFQAYVSHLTRAGGATNGHDRQVVRDAIRNTPHPTVWAEMKRQRNLHPTLEAYFNASPAALRW